VVEETTVTLDLGKAMCIAKGSVEQEAGGKAIEPRLPTPISTRR